MHSRGACANSSMRDRPAALAPPLAAPRPVSWTRPLERCPGAPDRRRKERNPKLHFASSVRRTALTRAPGSRRGPYFAPGLEGSWATPGIRPLTDAELAERGPGRLRASAYRVADVLRWLARGSPATSFLLPLSARRSLLRLAGIRIGAQVTGLKRCGFETKQVSIGDGCFMNAGCRVRRRARAPRPLTLARARRVSRTVAPLTWKICSVRSIFTLYE